MINDFDPNVHLDNMKPDSNESSGANDDSVFEDTETEMRYVQCTEVQNGRFSSGGGIQSQLQR